MTTTYTAEQIIAIGGSDWQRNGTHRVYLNQTNSMLGLDVDTYKSGNISSATLHGETISNAEAGRLGSALDKVYLDATTGTLHVQWGWHANRYDKADLMKQVTGWIAARVAELTPPEIAAPAAPPTVEQTAPAAAPSDTTSEFSV